MNEAARAYDAVAPAYDALFVERGRRTWSALYEPYLRPGARVIDAGCGTGADSLRAAHRGCVVRGFDVSPGMLEVASRRAVGHAIELQVGRLEDVGELYPPGSADVVLSGFAALNTCGDLPRFGAGCSRVLAPGGLLILHFLTPGGLYDRVGNLARGRPGLALGAWWERRLPVQIGAVGVGHTLIAPSRVEALLAPGDFERVARHQVGMLTPDDGPTRVPERVVRVLDAVEARLRAVHALAAWGRFAVLVLRRRGGPSSR